MISCDVFLLVINLHDKDGFCVGSMQAIPDPTYRPITIAGCAAEFVMSIRNLINQNTMAKQRPCMLTCAWISDDLDEDPLDRQHAGRSCFGQFMINPYFNTPSS